MWRIFFIKNKETGVRRKEQERISFTYWMLATNSSTLYLSRLESRSHSNKN